MAETRADMAARLASMGKGFTRDTGIKADAPPPAAVDEAATFGAAVPGDIGTGRDFRYEWEAYLADVLGRLVRLESAPGGPATSGVFAFAHQQPAPAATWTVSHGLNTKPGVTVVDSAGGLVLTEISYPDDNTAVVVFATPTAGTAYLRG